MENLGERVTARVAVIGAGYAGMAAAVSLCERGITPVVFETAKVLGGRARRIDYRGIVLDNGQHILSGAYVELLRLMAQVGAPRNALLRLPLTLDLPPEFSLRAPRLPAPFHMAAALLFARGISFAERLSLLRMIRALKARNFQLAPDLTVAALLAQHAQSEHLTRVFWQPLTVAALNTPAASASAQVLANVLRDTLASGRAASDLLLPQVDLSALFPEPAARYVAAQGGELFVGKRVQSIEASPTGFDISAEEVRSTVDAVILAVGPHQLDDLHHPVQIPPLLATEPIYTVYLQYPGAVALPQKMFGRANGLAQWFFDRSALAADGRTPAGLVAAVISASGAHQNLSSDVIAGTVHRELTALVGALPAPVWHKVIAEKFATFACTAGLTRPTAITVNRRIFLAGDFVANDYPATLEGAVRNGIAAAGLAAQALMR